MFAISGIDETNMDNSASLLLRILEDGRNETGHRPAADVWKIILNVQDISQLVEALGQFLVLVDKAGKDVLAVHDDLDGVNYWKTRIFNGFHSAALGSPWDGFKNQIDDISIFTLRSHAKIIKMQKPYKGLSEDEITASQNLFDEAAKALRDSKLDESVRITLLTRIEQIKAVLSRYRFLGPDAALDAAKILAAEIASVPKDEAQEIKKSGAYSKLKDGLEIIANASQIASSSPLLLTSSSYIIGLLS
ncbi:hypothetical protein ACQR53_17960 [Xanthomonas oryzae]|uniref:hypothetical protein n=1 Tax=Xanthomonas oryzae TaxID=347 RepID=UPI0010332878|nr:hypothetical protein [Xanthomonas oryzae]QBG86896.1 hypothetical protein EYC54_02875 [Xanthomonas oryzae]QBH01286.1 hypothetical protein EYC56_21005 [Xanthomonas oryzae]QBI14800.1 hypothetical protein EYR03_02295 [Xanthomonas oryzae pv. oryzae]TAO90502.1 hypothetical protein EYR05_02295 [Xanthomonas oryzae pv. oryzae]TAP18003.1 hypothetical protein EYR01_13990 [Xanthomonas oryzae pv. oryzae]